MPLFMTRHPLLLSSVKLHFLYAASAFFSQNPPLEVTNAKLNYQMLLSHIMSKGNMEIILISVSVQLIASTAENLFVHLNVRHYLSLGPVLPFWLPWEEIV